jgi:hypothetical protein
MRYQLVEDLARMAQLTVWLQTKTKKEMLHWQTKEKEKMKHFQYLSQAMHYL